MRTAPGGILQACNAIVDGIEHDRGHAVVPFMMRMTFLQHAVAPALVQWMMTASGFQRGARSG